MRKGMVCAVLTVLLLTGCGAQETFETVNDQHISAAASPQFLNVELPEEAAAPTLGQEDAGNLYLCDGYTIAVQTMPGGNLDATLSQLTGFSSERLTLMHTKQPEAERYECVWTAAGEGGDQVGRLVILDDGNYHYAVTVMAPAQTAGALTETWQELMNSVRISTD